MTFEDDCDAFEYDRALREGDIPDDAAKLLYKAARIALQRGNLDAITEYALKEAVQKAEQL